MKKVVHYCSVVPGTGKTSWAVKSIIKVLDLQQVVIYTAPTVELLQEVKAKLIKSGVPDSVISLIYAKDGMGLPALRHATLCLKGGRSGNARFVPTTPLVVLCTHTTFIRLPDGDYRKRCHVIYDEARKCVGQYERVNIKDPKPLLTFMEVSDEFKAPSFPREDGEFDTLFKANKTNRALRPTMFRIRRLSNSKTWNMWYRLTKHGGQHLLDYVTLLNVTQVFSDWKTATLLSAYFENSQLYHLLKREGFKLIDVTSRVVNPEMVEAIRKRMAATTITYVFNNEHVPMSSLFKGILSKSINVKKVQDKMTDLGVYLNPQYISMLKTRDSKSYVTLDERDRQVLALVNRHRLDGRKPIAYAVAKAIELNREWSLTYGYRERKIPITINVSQREHCPHQSLWENMPFQSQGLNKYQTHATVAFLAAVNPQPYIADLFGALCPDYDIEMDYMVEQAIQTAMRCSIRNIKSKLSPLVIVTSKHLATRMATHMMGEPKVVPPTDIVQMTIPSIVRFAKVEKEPEPKLSASDRAAYIHQKMRETSPTYKEWKQLTTKVVVYRHRGLVVRELIKARDELHKLHSAQWAKEREVFRAEFNKSK